MSRIRITLKPLDDGQKPVEIPYGKTTIGRGPFLGCSDKKVSRNHAVLEVTDKWEVFLTPTHVNPCFYQPTGDSPGQILKKDSPHKLEHGDTFSLLPKAFRYQLIVENDQEQNDQKDLKGKTNGSTAKCDAILNERNKDLKKAISNEDLNDANTVTDKSPSKEDPTTNTEKNCSKEESSPAKKSDENNKSQTVSNENSEKEKTTDTNSVSKTEEKPESDKDSVDKKDTKEDSQDEEEKCDEDNEEVEKPKCSEKVVEENESTLGNDAFAKDKTDSVQSTDKPESKEKSDSKKTEISASNGDENLDSNVDAGHEDIIVNMDFNVDDSNDGSKEVDLQIIGIVEENKSTSEIKTDENVDADQKSNELNQTLEDTIIATPVNENRRYNLRSKNTKTIESVSTKHVSKTKRKADEMVIVNNAESEVLDVNMEDTDAENKNLDDSSKSDRNDLVFDDMEGKKNENVLDDLKETDAKCINVDDSGKDDEIKMLVDDTEEKKIKNDILDNTEADAECKILDEVIESNENKMLVDDMEEKKNENVVDDLKETDAKCINVDKNGKDDEIKMLVDDTEVKKIKNDMLNNTEADAECKIFEVIESSENKMLVDDMEGKKNENVVDDLKETDAKCINVDENLKDDEIKMLVDDTEENKVKNDILDNMEADAECKILDKIESNKNKIVDDMEEKTTKNIIGDTKETDAESKLLDDESKMLVDDIEEKENENKLGVTKEADAECKILDDENKMLVGNMEVKNIRNSILDNIGEANAEVKVVDNDLNVNENKMLDEDMKEKKIENILDKNMEMKKVKENISSDNVEEEEVENNILHDDIEKKAENDRLIKNMEKINKKNILLDHNKDITKNAINDEIQFTILDDDINEESSLSDKNMEVESNTNIGMSLVDTDVNDHNNERSLCEADQSVIEDKCLKSAVSQNESNSHLQDRDAKALEVGIESFEENIDKIEDKENSCCESEQNNIETTITVNILPENSVIVQDSVQNVEKANKNTDILSENIIVTIDESEQNEEKAHILVDISEDENFSVIEQQSALPEKHVDTAEIIMGDNVNNVHLTGDILNAIEVDLNVEKNDVPNENDNVTTSGLEGNVENSHVTIDISEDENDNVSIIVEQSTENVPSNTVPCDVVSVALDESKKNPIKELITIHVPKDEDVCVNVHESEHSVEKVVTDRCSLSCDLNLDVPVGGFEENSYKTHISRDISEENNVSVNVQDSVQNVEKANKNTDILSENIIVTIDESEQNKEKAHILVDISEDENVSVIEQKSAQSVTQDLIGGIISSNHVDIAVDESEESVKTHFGLIIVTDDVSGSIREGGPNLSKAHSTVDLTSDENTDIAISKALNSKYEESLLPIGQSAENSANEKDDDEWDFQQEIQDIMNCDNNAIPSQKEKLDNTDEFGLGTGNNMEDNLKSGLGHKLVLNGAEPPLENDTPYNSATNVSADGMDWTELLNDEALKPENSIKESLGNQVEGAVGERVEKSLLMSKQLANIVPNQLCSQNTKSDISSHLATTSRILKSRSRKRRFSEGREDSDMKELLQTNKRIEEHLIDINNELKKKNDLQEQANKLQEEVIRLKQKKLKLMYLAANVKD